MVKDERRLIKITDTLCLSPQSYGARNSGMERFNVCVRTETGDLAGLEYIDRDSSGVYWFNDTSIGTIDSPDFAKYIRKFQFGPDLTAFEKKEIPHNEAELYQRVSEVYTQKKSLKQTAKLLGLSEERARRILITVGAYTCDIHEKAMNALKEGKTLDQAAELAGVKRNRIHVYLPYEV